MVIYKGLYYNSTKTYILWYIWDIFGIDRVTTRFDPDFAVEGGWPIFDFEEGLTTEGGAPILRGGWYPPMKLCLETPLT